jgi:phenylacetate-coenzyme A ligase PaaK-like adenylate-forming protein
MMEPLVAAKANSINGSQALLPAHQLDRIASTVPRWLAEVPLYQGLWPQRGGHEPDLDFFRRFRSLPIITKHEIRRGFPHNFLRAGVALEYLLERELVELERTSGTT